MKNNLPNQDEYLSPWFDPPAGEATKAVVLLLHGLNLKPQKMDGWAEELTAKGALVIRFALLGHSGDPKEMRRANEEVWQKQFRQALDLAQEKSQELGGVPLYFLGFSLGALVALESLTKISQPTPPIKKMVLIAPAIATPWYSKVAVKIFSIFGRSFILPSRSPKSYRATSGTSVGAYQALFSLKKSLEEARYKNTNVNTLVLIDRHDELVPANTIKDIVREYRLNNWDISIVDNRYAHDNYGFRHLMVDQEAIGSALWQDLRGKVLAHFEL